MYGNNAPILTSEQYYQKFAPGATELFNAAKIRCQQINPTWKDKELNNFAYSVLWLMGKSEYVGAILRWNYYRISHMRNAARSANALCCTPTLTPIGHWGFESALEFVFAHFEKQMP